LSAYRDTTFSSADRDISEQWLADVYGRVALTRDFGRFNQHLVVDERLLIATSKWDGVMGSTVDPEQFVVISAELTSPWEDGGGTGDLAAEPALFRPGVPFSARSDQATHIVGFDPAALQRTARLLYGRDDLQLRFDGGHPVGPSAAAHWRALTEAALSSIEAGLLRHHLVRASAYHLMAVSVLEGFRLIGDTRELRASAERRLEVFRRGADFLAAFASLPITIEDAAEAAGAVVPELVDAFRAHTAQELTPSAFLRNRRLAAAMADLEAADPTLGDTVQEIAHRWGFASPSRFAAQFRARYGVNPKWVLDR
jgi:AraC-like DNA-binding protein